MIELSNYGRIYVPERSDVRIRKSSKAVSDWWLGVLLIVIMGVCPLVGLFIA